MGVLISWPGNLILSFFIYLPIKRGGGGPLVNGVTDADGSMDQFLSPAADREAVFELPREGWYHCPSYIILYALSLTIVRWTFLVFFVFELGSLLCGVATSSKMLIVARAVAGLRSAGLMNGLLTITSACIPLHKRPSKFGIYSSMLVGDGSRLS